MKKISLLCLVFIIAILAFSGCKKQEAKETEGKSKETLVIGYGTELDPYIPISNNEYILPLCGISNDTLVNYDNGEIKPSLAESFKIENDGKDIIFHLRKDVTFHNGDEFNADAVVKNLLYYKDYEMFSWMKGISNIKEVTALDKYTVKVSYEEGYYGALADMSSSYKIPMINPNMIIQGDYEKMNAPIGCGPYIYDSMVKGEYTKFIRNENYWGEKPKFKEIIVKFIPDSGTRLKALQTGEIDVVFSSIFINYDEYKQAISLDGIEGKISEKPVKTRNIVVNASSENLKDINVRKAIAIAINKESIVSGYTYGYESVADKLFSNNLKFCDVNMNNKFEYNKEEAKKLLENSGWILNEGEKIRTKDGKKLSLVFTYPSDATLNKEIVSAISSDMLDIGIEVIPQGQEFMTWWMEGMEGKYDLSVGTTYGPPYDPHNYITPMMDSLIDMVAIKGLSDSEEFFDVLMKSTKTADSKTVKKQYEYILNYLNDNVIEVPLSYQKEMIIYRSDVIKEYDFGGLSTEINPNGFKTK